MLNVNRKLVDQYYRYKMPKLLAKREGNKTVIVNMVDIGKALARPAAYPTKFFGCELGTQIRMDKKNARYSINGSHNSEKLQDILDLFIEKFVLCKKCENPETRFIVQPKKEKITALCAACGHSSLVDMRYRLSTFVLKNPPESYSDIPQKMEKLKKEKGRLENDETSPNEESGFNDWSGEVNDRQMNCGCDGAEDWGEDTSEEAVKKRQEEGLCDGVKTLTFNKDLEKSVEERFNIFFTFVKNKINESGVDLPDKLITSEAERLDIKDRGVLVLAELLLTDDILNEIPRYRKLFLRFLANNQRAQKIFLGAFELVVAQCPEVLVPKTSHILKLFYDLDLVEEEVLLEWGAKVSKKYASKEISEKIHANAKPFIDWLKTAEEESEEGEDVEVVYTNRSEAAILKENKECAVNEDFNIDDI